MNLMNNGKTDKVQKYMDEYANCGFFNGSVLVAHKGNVLFSTGYGLANRESNSLNTPQTKFRIASLSKGFTAMAIMLLVEAELLRVEDTLSKFIPDYPLGDQITVHQLLTHSSGIVNFSELPHFDEKIRPFLWKTENLVNEFKFLAGESKPGERHGYCNTGYILLTFIIELISKQSYEVYLKTHIFKPLGMENTDIDFSKKIVSNRAAGYHVDKEFIHPDYANMSSMSGAAGLYSTVEDLYLWDRALYTDVLISKQTRERIFTPYFAYYGGYGWDVTLAERKGIFRKKIAHLGQVEGFNSYIARYVDDEFTVIVLSNTSIAPVEIINDNLSRIFFGEDIPAPKVPAIIELKLNGMEGEYLKETNRAEKISFTLENNQLFFKPNSWQGLKYPVHPVRVEGLATDLVAEYIAEQFSFLRDEFNMVNQVIYTNAKGEATLFVK